MIYSRIVEILNEETNIFINNIAFELEKPHNHLFDNFGFPMFGEISKDYHEQVYFQSYLESYTRKLINSILKRILEADAADEFNWPEFEIFGVYNGYTNDEYEREYDFEFINTAEKVGYRYTLLEIEHIDGLLAKHSLFKIKIVIWDNSDYVAFDYSDERVQTILLREMLAELLFDLSSEEIDSIYSLFTEAVNDAVARASAMISLVTVPGFTSSYLYKTKGSILKNLVSEVEGLSSFYVNNEKFKRTEIDSKKLIDEYRLSEFFLEQKMQDAFVGKSHFAKSFLTSEYLFRYFEKNPLFDYTPIVSGYIKAIEQIMHEICVSYRNSRGIMVDMHSYTLGNYTRFLDDNVEILRAEIRPAKGIIRACLESFRIENRNHLFHKDYFDSWDRVKSIRKNAIFLYVVLLGATEQFLLTKEPRILGIVNDEYNELFSKLDSLKEGDYTIEISGKEYHNMRKYQRSEGIVFDRTGVVKNTILFKGFDYDHWEEITISSKNMPASVWQTDIYGKKDKKIW